MAKLDCSNSLAVIFYCNFFLMLFTDLQKSHINERFKQYLAFHFVDSNWQLDSEPILTNHLDYFRLIFELLTFVFDFCGGRESGGDFWLHGVDDFEVRIFRLLKSDPFGSIGEVPDLDSDFIILIDLDILKDHFCRNDLEGLSVN